MQNVNARVVAQKIITDFNNKKFVRHSTSLICYVKNNKDVEMFCEELLKLCQQFKTIYNVLSFVARDATLPRCAICGNFIPYDLVKNKKGNAIFCSKNCAFTEAGKKIQVDKFKKATDGVNPMQRKDVKDKVKNTLLKKYGVDNISKLKEYREKAKNTCIEKFGVDNIFKSSDFIKNQSIKNRNRFFDGFKLWCESIDIEPLFDSSYKKDKGKFKCKKCGFEFSASRSYRSSIFCKKCVLSATQSKKEHDLSLWLSQFVNIDLNNKSILKNHYELDIYEPNKNVAIEFNGLYWHSEARGKDRFYHLNKLDECNENGIRLLQVFEDEWKFKQDIIKSRIKNILGFIPYKIGARKCEIRNVDNKTAKKFLDKYHLQGNCSAHVKIGLFYKNKLVALMTFGKPRFNKKYDWELIRYCTVSNFNIIGGAGKLLSYFRKNYQGSIITYADRRFSNGDMYKKLGFKFLYNSEPNYFYVKGLRRLSRYECQKHKLKSVIKNFDSKLSEYENMLKNKFYRIWDCGNMVFATEQK